MDRVSSTVKGPQEPGLIQVQRRIKGLDFDRQESIPSPAVIERPESDGSATPRLKEHAVNIVDTFEDPQFLSSEDEPDPDGKVGLRKNDKASEAEEGSGNNNNNNKKSNSNEKAPEQRISIFALRLALIEKGATGLGALAFLWATVVILGGFATTVNETDFWVVTLIILAESSRIFSRSHELEWQQLSVTPDETLTRTVFRASNTVKSQIEKCIDGEEEEKEKEGASHDASKSSKASNALCFRKRKPRLSGAASHRIHVGDSKIKDHTRTWDAPFIQLLPFTHHVVTTQLVSRLLYAVQILSAIMSIGLPIWRLRQQDYFHQQDSAGGSKPPNIMVSMNVFYIMSMVEAGMFLIEKFFWEYGIRVSKLLQTVNTEAELGSENLGTIKQFFYEVYSQCLKGSIFDGLEMDLVSFSISWLQVEDFKQQLCAVRLLNRIVSQNDGKARKDHFAFDCLRRLGTSPGVLERLVEMLSWNSRQEQQLLSDAAAIICRLVVYNRNCSRIVGIPGSIEALLNLLLLPLERSNSEDSQDPEEFEAYLELRVKALRIFKYLCKDHKNCVRIGETKGLLSTLISFIEVRSENSFDEIMEDRNSPNYEVLQKKLPSHRLKTYKKSLQVIGLLAAGSNTSGGVLRRTIADVVSGLKNLRDVIDFCDSRPDLQRSSVQILYHLAIDPDVRKTIGATGGIIRNLYQLFSCYVDVSPEMSKDPKSSSWEKRQLASLMAGKTLFRIVLQNEKNCLKLVLMKSESDESFLKCMIRFLGKSLEAEKSASLETACCSAEILRSVMIYVDDGLKRRVAADAAQVVFQLIQMRYRQGRSSLYESFLGLASRVLDHLSFESYSRLIGTVITKFELGQLILKDLKHTPSTNRYPRIRRYSIELLISVLKKDQAAVEHELLEFDESFLRVLQKSNVSLVDELHRTLDSISDVENFCLFSGLVGYARHLEDMEVLVGRAIHQVKPLDELSSFAF
ncbi:hypothetical protein R1flu_024866 [Riccia fluitans]|uniref:Uncharacterized protein n=1 Tax=Riccia fluitans TaxID=41844 RepID=A0ABD1XW43_9MARC